MTLLRVCLAALVSTTFFVASAYGQSGTARRAADVAVTGASGKRFTVDANTMATLPRVSLRVVMQGQAHEFSGAPLATILARVDAPLGPALHGDALTNAVFATAADGYQVVLSLAEIDPAMHKGAVILADRMDGKPLSDFDGPYRLIVEADLRPARSARMVTRIEVKDVGIP